MYVILNVSKGVRTCACTLLTVAAQHRKQRHGVGADIGYKFHSVGPLARVCPAERKRNQRGGFVAEETAAFGKRVKGENTFYAT